MVDVSRQLAQPHRDIIGALQRLRPVIVAVANVHAAAKGRKFHLESRQPVAKGGECLRRDDGIAPGSIQCHLGDSPCGIECLGAGARMISFFAACHSGCSLAPEFGNARFKLTHAPQSECLGLGNQLVAQAVQVVAASG